MSNIYSKLEKIVLPHLAHYQTDLTKHDKATLEGYDGPFVYGFRHCGTNLIKLQKNLPLMLRGVFRELPDDKQAALDKIEKILVEDIIWITYSNTMFLHYDGKKLRPVSKEEVTKIHNDHVRKEMRMMRLDVDTIDFQSLIQPVKKLLNLNS